MPPNEISAPGMVPPATPSPTKIRAGRFGSRLAPFRRNAHWFSLLVGSSVSWVSVPLAT
jgi:hypothetical protein